MRWIPFIALLIAPAIGVAGPAQSNPAFLGIGFQADCHIDSVTKLSAAADAGVQVNDVILALDDVPLGTHCAQLLPLIVAHQPGDRVRIDLRRGDRTIVATAVLTTRAEVVQKHVGARMESTRLVDTSDPRHTYDLGQRHGQTTIVGWFGASCTGCAKVFDRVEDGLRRRLHDAPPLVLAVEPFVSTDPLADPAPKLASFRKDFASSVPLAVTDEATVDALAMIDSDRVFFMVIDGRGIVQFVAPVAPDADDLDAALDDVLAAAEQAEHARTSSKR